MPAVGLCKNRFDIPLSNVASIGLVETDLQLAPKRIIDNLLEIVLGDKHVDSPSLVVFDLDCRPTTIGEGLPLLGCNFRDHATVLLALSAHAREVI